MGCVRHLKSALHMPTLFAFVVPLVAAPCVVPIAYAHGQVRDGGGVSAMQTHDGGQGGVTGSFGQHAASLRFFPRTSGADPGQGAAGAPGRTRLSHDRFVEEQTLQARIDTMIGLMVTLQPKSPAYARAAIRLGQLKSTLVEQQLEDQTPGAVASQASLPSRTLLDKVRMFFGLDR